MTLVEEAFIWLFVVSIIVSLQIALLFPRMKVLLFVCVLGMAIGALRTNLYLTHIETNHSLITDESRNYTHITSISGIVGSLLKNNDTTKVFRLQAEKIGKTFTSDIFFELEVPTNSKIQTGDRIRFESKILPIRASQTFAFDKYFLSKNIYGKLSASNISILDNTSSWYDVSIGAIRDLFSSHIQAIYPPRTAAFLGGLLFGERQNLDATIDTDFKLSGLSHIVAVSGFNITILIVFFTSVLRFLPTWVRVSIITLIVIVFNSLVGEQISALRATIMGLAGYYAVSLGKKSDLLNVLLATALFFALKEPYTLNYDVSYHLSFFAVAGMMFTSDYFKHLFRKIPDVLGMKESLIATLGALSFTFPFSLLNFGQLPLLSPIANLFATPLLPITMLVGFGSILIDTLSHTVGIWIGFVGWILLEYTLMVAHFFASLKKTILFVDYSVYGFYILSGYYLLISYILLLNKSKSTPPREEVLQVEVGAGKE